MTLEKHFMNSIIYIKTFQKIVFYAFNAIIKLFFTIVYIRIITITLIFGDHPLVEYPLLISLNLFDGHSFTLFIQIIHNNAVKSRFYDPKYAVTNFTDKLITVNFI